MGKTEIAYMAGFFDGEGSIHIDSCPMKRPRRLIVQLGQANEWVLKIFQFQFGGKIYEHHDKRQRRQLWQWRLNSQQALDFLLIISPYLKLKKAEAEIAIKFQQAKSPRGKKLTEEEAAIEEAQAILVHSLKDKSNY